MEQDDINKFIHDLDLTRAYFEKGNGNISVNEALMYAVIFSRYDVAKYLIKKGADPNWKPTKKDEFYENPLLNLILSVNVFWGEEANLELIKTLLLAGADPHMKDKQGHDAYYYASINYPKRKRRIIDMLNLHAGSLQNLARAKVPQKTLKKYPHLQDECKYCGTEYAEYRCGNCLVTTYCGEECASKDWKHNHHKICF